MSLSVWTETGGGGAVISTEAQQLDNIEQIIEPENTRETLFSIRHQTSANKQGQYDIKNARNDLITLLLIDDLDKLETNPEASELFSKVHAVSGHGTKHRRDIRRILNDMVFNPRVQTKGVKLEP